MGSERFIGGKWRLMDSAEALANAVVGFGVSWGATFFVLGYSPTGAMGVTTMFFGLSLGRSYILRKVFRWLAR